MGRIPQSQVQGRAGDLPPPTSIPSPSAYMPFPGKHSQTTFWEDVFLFPPHLTRLLPD